MKKRDNNSLVSNAKLFAALYAGLTAILIVAYYIIKLSSGYLHSDCTDTILWAQASLDSHSVFNADFSYACMLPFGGQLIMLPLVKVFGFTMKAQICGMFIFFILFVISIILIARAMDMNIKWVSITMAGIVMAVSFSEKLREIFWGHIIYYSLGIFFLFIGMALILRILSDRTGELSINNKKLIMYLVMLFLWNTACSTNGMQALAIFTVPVLGALIGVKFFDFSFKLKDKNNYKYYVVNALLITSTFIGLQLSKIMAGGITANYAKAYSTFSPSSEWPKNFINLITGWFTLLGVDAKTTDLLYSKNGIFSIIKIVCAAVLAVVPIIMACMYKHFKNISYHLMIFVHFIMTSLILIAWIFGILNSANWRLSPIVATSAMLSIMFAKWIAGNTNVKRCAAIIMFPLTAASIVTVMQFAKLPVQTADNKKLIELINTLEANNLDYGYGTFWNANAVTLLSDSKVKIRDINLQNDGFSPRYFQSNKRWYDTIPEQEKYFVVLSVDEFGEYSGNSDKTYPTPLYTLFSNGYVIMVYDYNIV